MKWWIFRAEGGGKCGGAEVEKGSLRGFLPGEKKKGVGKKRRILRRETIEGELRKTWEGKFIRVYEGLGDLEEKRKKGKREV